MVDWQNSQNEETQRVAALYDSSSPIPFLSHTDVPVGHPLLFRPFCPLSQSRQEHERQKFLSDALSPEFPDVSIPTGGGGAFGFGVPSSPFQRIVSFSFFAKTLVAWC